MDRSRDGVMEEDVDLEELEQSTTESSRSTDVQSSFTANLVAPTPAAFPCGRAAPADEESTAAATSLRGAATKKFSGNLVEGVVSEEAESPVQNSPGTQGVLRLRPLRYRPGPTRLRALLAPACQLNHHHMFLRKTKRMIALHLN